MFGLATAWMLYDRARYVTGAAKDVRHVISYLLPKQLDGEVRRLLENLGKRVDTILPALRFCLLWSHDKGTAVSTIVFQAREVINSIEKFIQTCSDEENKSKLLNRDYMMKTLQGHIQDLDFALQTVNLALSLINASSHSLYSISDTSKQKSSPPGLVSPSTLLRATSRLRQMHNSGGDVTLNTGSFHQIRYVTNETASFTSISSTSASMSHVSEQSLSTPTWKTVCKESLMKVYRNLNRRCYELHVVNLPADTPVETKDKDFCEPSTPSVNSVSILDSDLERSPTSKRIFELSLSMNFCWTSSKALGIEDIKDPLSVCFTWVDTFANEIQTRYAFVIHDASPSSELSGGSTQVLQPLDVVYITRLSIYENLHVPKKIQKIIVRQPDDSPVKDSLTSSPVDIQTLEIITRQPAEQNVFEPDADLEDVVGDMKSSSPEKTPSMSPKDKEPWENGDNLAHTQATDEELWILLGNTETDRDTKTKVEDFPSSTQDPFHSFLFSNSTTTMKDPPPSSSTPLPSSTPPSSFSSTSLSS